MKRSSLAATRARLEEVYATLDRLRAQGVALPKSLRRSKQGVRDAATPAEFVARFVRWGAEEMAHAPYLRNASETNTRVEIKRICEAIADALEAKA